MLLIEPVFGGRLHLWHYVTFSSSRFYLVVPCEAPHNPAQPWWVTVFILRLASSCECLFRKRRKELSYLLSSGRSPHPRREDTLSETSNISSLHPSLPLLSHFLHLYCGDSRYAGSCKVTAFSALLLLKWPHMFHWEIMSHRWEVDACRSCSFSDFKTTMQTTPAIKT